MEGQNVIEVKPLYASEVHRALIVLGFSEAERSKAHGVDVVPIALKTFSSWIDRVQALPVADEELRATWVEFMRARFGGSEPPVTPTAVNEAAHAAHYAITMQLQLFPPRTRTVIGTDLGMESCAELQEWRDAAKQRGWDSPLLMRDHVATESVELIAWRTAAQLHGMSIPKQLESMAGFRFAEFTELQEWRKAATANGFDSPADLASVQDANLKQFADERVVKEWQKATGCDSPHKAEVRIMQLTNTLSQTEKERSAAHAERQRDLAKWQLATGCATPKDAESFRSAWCTETNCMFPIEAGNKIRSLRENANAEFKRRVDAEKYLHDIESAQFEFTRIRPGYARLAEEIATAWRQTNLTCSLLSSSLTREQRRAEIAEGMLRIEQQNRDDTKKELLAANQKLASAIVPLVKPKEVAAGQLWVEVSSTRNIGYSATGGVIVNVGPSHDAKCVSTSYMLSSENWLYLGS